MEADQKKLQTLSESLQKLQDDLQTSISALQTLQSQSAENKAVQKEFQALPSTANIYKLVGPVLLKQERSEANGAVDGRLEFIGKEIARTETRIKELQAESERKRGDLMGVQQRLQMKAQEQQQVAG